MARQKPHRPQSLRLFSTRQRNREHRRRLPLPRLPPNRHQNLIPPPHHCPTPPPTKTTDNLPTNSPFFMDCYNSATRAQEKGIELATQAKYNSSWRIWLEFLNKSEISDSHLDTYTPINRARILCTFMDAVRNGTFSRLDTVKGDTAATALDNVATTITASGRDDPRLNKAIKTHLMIQRQKRSYKKVDPPTKHQKALPPEVYRQLLRTAISPRDKARATTLGGSVFFCTRSCEYSKTPRTDQKTRPIRVCDIVFRIGAYEIPHNHPYLHMAHTVSIQFGVQKSDILDETVPQDRTDDPELCAVLLWASVVRRISAYPNFNPQWPVYTYHDGKKFSYLSNAEYIIDIRAIVDAIGPQVLGFTSKDVGTHSNRSGGAMMMYLAKTPPYTIMMIGRWSSNAFLKYIEKQVLEFSKGVSKKMLLCNTFFNIPIRPWTETNTDFTRSAQQYYMPALRQVYGPARANLREQLFSSLSTANS